MSKQPAWATDAHEIYKALCAIKTRADRKRLQHQARKALEASEGAPERVREYCEAYTAGVF